MTPPPTLLAVPNVSEGRDRAALDAIGAAFAEAEGVRLLDRHSDRDHHRTVFTLAAHPGALADALLKGARVAVEEIQIGDGRGAHPHVGAIDVVPLISERFPLDGLVDAFTQLDEDRGINLKFAIIP